MVKLTRGDPDFAPQKGGGGLGNLWYKEWSNYGQIMVKLWSNYGQIMASCSRLAPVLLPSCSRLAPVLLPVKVRDKSLAGILAPSLKKKFQETFFLTKKAPSLKKVRPFRRGAGPPQGAGKLGRGEICRGGPIFENPAQGP